jgi:hypothetical protein
MIYVGESMTYSAAADSAWTSLAVESLNIEHAGAFWCVDLVEVISSWCA